MSLSKIEFDNGLRPDYRYSSLCASKRWKDRGGKLQYDPVTEKFLGVGYTTGGNCCYGHGPDCNDAKPIKFSVIHRQTKSVRGDVLVRDMLGCGMKSH